MKNASLRETATDSLKNLGHRVSDMRERVSDFVSENTDLARERVSDAYDGARRRVVAGVRTTRGAVRRHPLEAITIAFSVGLVIGTISGLAAGRNRD